MNFFTELVFLLYPDDIQENEPCRNLEDSHKRIVKGRSTLTRPKSESFDTVPSKINHDPSSTSLVQQNLNGLLYNLSTVDLKQKLDSCPGNLGDCPLINDIREGLKKKISDHGSPSKSGIRLCKTSRIQSTKDNNWFNERGSAKMLKQTSNECTDKKRITKDGKAATTNPSNGIIRSTRAQDLRSQSNRDLLLKPKTTNEKTRTTSPYIKGGPQKKKKSSVNLSQDVKPTAKSNTVKTIEEKKKIIKNEKNTKLPTKTKLKKEKSSSAGESVSLQRQKTQDIINPKIIKGLNQSLAKTAAGDCGDRPPLLKKSQTFFICKGAKHGEGDDKPKNDLDHKSWNLDVDSINDANGSDEDAPSPKLKPLTHNDSFCLIVKSSQNWSQKNRSDDEKWLRYGMSCDEKSKKSSDKGILKNSSCDLKSVDSVEKIESEKIVRFSDELMKNKKVLKKLVRRKKRLQNFLTPNWYQKNKLFQKYLQILREKSVLLSDGQDTPDDLKPFRVPIQVKERYEAEMFGLYPRKGKYVKNQAKDTFGY